MFFWSQGLARGVHIATWVLCFQAHSVSNFIPHMVHPRFPFLCICNSLHKSKFWLPLASRIDSFVHLFSHLTHLPGLRGWHLLGCFPHWVRVPKGPSSSFRPAKWSLDWIIHEGKREDKELEIYFKNNIQLGPGCGDAGMFICRQKNICVQCFCLKYDAQFLIYNIADKTPTHTESCSLTQKFHS